MTFNSRQHAGDLLAERLVTYHFHNPVVLALPRGGVVVAAPIARALKSPLDVVITRKIGHVTHPEYAVAAIGPTGTTVTNPREGDVVNQPWFDAEVARQKNEIERRAALFRHNRPPTDLSGATAILVDDGVATGLTLETAILEVHKSHPLAVVVALPVCPPEFLTKLKRLADTVVVLEAGEPYLGAVGAYYRDFGQVSDEEVVRLLAEAK